MGARPGAPARRVAWAAPACLGAVALAFCTYAGIDPGHVAVFTAAGICLGFVYALLALWGLTRRQPLRPSFPPTGNGAFRGMSFSMLSGRLDRHGAAAATLAQALATATALAGGDPGAIGPASARLAGDLAADRGPEPRVAAAAAGEIRSWLAQRHTTPSAGKGTR
ncbi:MAG: hypothetical protein ABWX68_07835 [Arthrobacter sp.]|uniref:hypothetical protein n=1 Tax=Arthrobacter sp. TaxID=1667 RepID=UPI0034750580